MAIWKVSAERAEIFPHPNSDRMDLCKVGMFQLVGASDLCRPFRRDGSSSTGTRERAGFRP